MKEYIDKLKEIEALVELSIGTTMTEEKATDIYALTNDLMCKVKKLNIPVVSCSLLGYFIAKELIEGYYKKWLITEIDENGMMTGTDINSFGHIQTLFIHKDNERVKEVVMLNCN